MKSLNLIILLGLSGVVLWGCSPFPELLQSDPEGYEPEILWQVDAGLTVTNHVSGLLYEDNLIIPGLSPSGLSSVSSSDGNLNWHNSETTRILTNPIIWKESVIYLSKGLANEANIVVCHSITGQVEGYAKISDFLEYESVNYYGDWLRLYDNHIYFSLWCENFTGAEQKICRVDLDSLTLNPDKNTVVEPETILEINPTCVAGVAPIFEDDRIFIFQGAAAMKIPEDDPNELGMGYYQSDIRFGCYDLDGTVIWEINPGYVGSTGQGEALLQFYEEDYLFAGCHDGLILLDKATGEIVYEKEHDPLKMQFDDFYTFNGEYVYSTAYKHLRCFHVPTGELVWDDEKNYSRDCKPIIFKDHVYVVDSDALRYYDKKNGKLLGENEDLGVPGYRYQRYMPWKDDILYILRTEEIVAIRME